jgi:hypothetical protein
MDDIVKAALKKWPNVPHCHDWLGLDARGDWYLRDERTQAAGDFPDAKGSRVVHDKLKAFIHRNYGPDEHGAWFFQNGPQRVYVWLEAAPLVLGVAPAAGRTDTLGATGFRVEFHTGEPVAEVKGCWLDEFGRLYLETERGLGVVRSLDMDAAADAVVSGLWVPQDIDFDLMPAQFGFIRRPLPGGPTQA